MKIHITRTLFVQKLTVVYKSQIPPPSFYATQIFITVATTARHWAPTLTRRIHLGTLYNTCTATRARPRAHTASWQRQCEMSLTVAA